MPGPCILGRLPIRRLAPTNHELRCRSRLLRATASGTEPLAVGAEVVAHLRGQGAAGILDALPKPAP